MLKTQITGAKYLSPQTNQMTNLNIAIPADSKDTEFGTSDILLAKDVVTYLNALDSDISKELATKANKSDVLLKKSASGGYYIEANNNQLGEKAFAANSDCTASGMFAYAEGFSVASGYVSHAEGYATASGAGSHAESSATASGAGSHAEDSATASGVGSHAESSATASGSSSHAEGLSKAAGDFSHAEGINTEASRECSHAEGKLTKASGTCSHAEGKRTQASGMFTHAEGGSTKAAGTYSHSEGYNTEASGMFSHAEGISNVVDVNAIHSIGIGDDTVNKNAEYIYSKNRTDITIEEDPKNGYKYLIGVGGYDGVSTDNTTYKSVQEVIADLTARIEQLETKVRALEAANTPA